MTQEKKDEDGDGGNRQESENIGSCRRCHLGHCRPGAVQQMVYMLLILSDKKEAISSL